MRLTDKIKIFHQTREEDGNSIQLGYMILYDEKEKGSKPLLRRFDNAKSWARQGHQVIDLDNKPRSGFSIAQTVSRYSTDNKVWRVVDPSGVVFEITSYNLDSIISQCDLKKGKISGSFVWASTNGYNILLNVKSDEYKRLIKRPAKAPTLAQLKPGYVVEGARNERFEYIGKVHKVGQCYRGMTFDENLHGFLSMDTRPDGSRTLDTCKTKKLFMIESKNERTTEEMIDVYNKNVNKDGWNYYELFDANKHSVKDFKHTISSFNPKTIASKQGSGFISTTTEDVLVYEAGAAYYGKLAFENGSVTMAHSFKKASPEAFEAIFAMNGKKARETLNALPSFFFREKTFSMFGSHPNQLRPVVFDTNNTLAASVAKGKYKRVVLGIAP